MADELSTLAITGARAWAMTPGDFEEFALYLGISPDALAVYAMAPPDPDHSSGPDAFPDPWLGVVDGVLGLPGVEDDGPFALD